MVAPLVKGGKPVEYLAHWLPEGGYDSIPRLCGDGYLIVGDSAMLFNALHREGSNLAMASGRHAALALLEALEKGDFSERGLAGYAERMRSSHVLKDMEKYRRFPGFLAEHEEIFRTLPELTAYAAREILSVDSIPKKEKQRIVWKAVRRRMSLLRLLRLAWDGWRSVR